MKAMRIYSVLVGIIAALFLGSWFLLRKGYLPASTMLLLAVQSGVAQGPTVVHVSDTVLHANVKRLGVNLGGQSFYDSHQILRNLVSRNPGFEGEELQTILQCRDVTPTSCTDWTLSTAWPEGFLDGASYEIIAGAAKGQTGTILHSTKADKAANKGATITFAQGSKSPAANDFFVIRRLTAGGAEEGWWLNKNGNATTSTEFKDLSPNTPGKQALRMNAAAKGASLALTAFFDTTDGHSFVQMRGPYVIRFRAKAVSGGRSLNIRLGRPAAHVSLFEKAVPLTNTWQDYSFEFNAADPGQVGGASLSFSVFESEILIDDVSLTSGAPNGTSFRHEVVAALQRLHPGILRDMDGQTFGASLDNMLSVEEARRRTNWSKYVEKGAEIPIGLHDFLVLCEKIGAEPWYTMQTGMTEQEGRDLMEYLGGGKDTKYGARRIALGHPEPWTKTFPTIHLEFGNENWNQVQQGEIIPQPIPYADRMNTIFRAIKSSPWYSSSRFNLIANGQAGNTYLTGKILENANQNDSIDFAPYLFGPFSDDSSIENIFGPMFAQPEQVDDSSKGYMRLQAELAAHAKRPVKVAIYETNMGTVGGTVGQASVDKTVPSVGAGITSVEHMLLMLRDLGIVNQNTFQLGGYHFRFDNSATHEREFSPVWGIVVDMGGLTNRVRPVFLAQQIADSAILPTMLTTTISGSNPTWNQPLSVNGSVQLDGAHELQTFAFTDGKKNSLILINLSRTANRPVVLDGAQIPKGTVHVQTLTSANITDSNETELKVIVRERDEHNVVPGKTTFPLPPFSMTVLSSDAKQN